jgi:GT2 family glycosyltransferase
MRIKKLDKELPTGGVLIFNRNGKSWLQPVYESFGNHGYPKVRIYLVDNVSSGGSVELTLENYPEVTVIRMPKNLEYCMAYNLAILQKFADG